MSHLRTNRAEQMFSADIPEDRQPNPIRTALPVQELMDPDALTCGQHSANEWSDTPELRPDGRHDINGHPDDHGQLSVDTLLSQTATVTPAALRVRCNNDRYSAWWAQQRRRTTTSLYAAMNADTVRIPRIPA